MGAVLCFLLFFLARVSPLGAEPPRPGGVPPPRRSPGPLRYTKDGNPPDEDSPLYRGPIRVSRPRLVRAAFFRPDGSRGPLTRVPCVPALRRDAAGTEPGLKVSFAAGKWMGAPDFDRLPWRPLGAAAKLDVSPAKRPRDFALRFEGFLKIPREGIYTFHLYTFHLYADDGARLALCGATFLDTVDLHAFAGRKASLRLKPGTYPFRLDFFQVWGGAKLRVHLEGPGLKKGDHPRRLALPRLTRLRSAASGAGPGRTDQGFFLRKTRTNPLGSERKTGSYSPAPGGAGGGTPSFGDARPLPPNKIR